VVFPSTTPETPPWPWAISSKWANAEFYGKWLLAAAKADALWKEAIKDSAFEMQVNRLLVVYIPDFSIVATVLLSRLVKNLVSFVVRLNDEEEGEEFAMMVEMGLFILTGQRYQMVIPTRLNMDRVKRAALKFAKTEDEEYYLHPEYLVATMPYAEAKAWQSRLREMDEVHRHADRLLLLETSSGFVSAHPGRSRSVFAPQDR
jgi:hypothetical protein